MTDRYAVFGHPIAHSKSPRIHAMFAAQTGQQLIYEAILAPLDGFLQKIRDNATLGLKGANVTVPFKEEAFRLATQRTARAERAGAVNTLSFESNGAIVGDNTDGAGLVRDLVVNLGISITGKQVLVLGAGGAVRGVLAPLLAESPKQSYIANRSASKAIELAKSFGDLGSIEGGGLDTLAGKTFDLVINGTSASLSGERPAIPEGVFAAEGTAYDMMYGKGDTPFLAFARVQGARHCHDGLGMLAEQAAEAFFIWRGVRPDTAPVLASLRAELLG